MTAGTRNACSRSGVAGIRSACPSRRRSERNTNRGATTIPAKVFVGNLSFRTTKEELSALLAEAGSVVDVYLPNDRETGKPRGFAFVEFASEAEAAEAIRRFNGREVGGRNLKVNSADERPRERSAAPRPARPAPAPSWAGPPRGEEPSYFAVEGRESRPKGSRRGVRGRKRAL